MLAQLAACLLGGTTVYTASPVSPAPTEKPVLAFDPGSNDQSLIAALPPGDADGSSPPTHSPGFPANHDVVAEVISQAQPGLTPYFVGLPFDPKADPALTRHWLRPGGNAETGPRFGGWVEIRNEQLGLSCYARWEVVDPPGSEDADYVFSNEPVTGNGTGLSVSPAVAKYLDLNPQHPQIVGWRFVEDKNVAPGAWLRSEEQALVLQALNKRIPDKNIPPATPDGRAENEQTLYLKAYLLLNDAEQEVAAHRIPEARKDYDRALKKLHALVAADPGAAGDFQQTIARAQAARDALKVP
jgi:hypothetical protein